VRVEVARRPGPGPGATVVRIGGTLESDTVAAAREAVEPVLRAAPRVVVFDLGELTFLSSVGISLLLEARRTLSRAGSSVFLTNLQPQIAKVMEIVDAIPKTSVFADLAEMDEYLAEIQRRVQDEGA
jgi:anti-anti-sigma factor